MSEIYDIKKEKENVILVGVCLDKIEDTQELLEELEELVETAGAKVIAKIIQNREKAHPGTYLGKGKIEELKEMIEALGATGIVCDDELSPAQLKNLEEQLDSKVMDRTMIILDIFAQRASTKEGQIQVEMAQLQYSSSRLIGLRSSLSRLGGGIGTRGPGEKKLEMDRRLIKDRLAQLNRELEEVKRSRDTTRMQRNKNLKPVVAIVGYTNAGKSTLINKLTNAGVLEENKLFATLDPTTRNLVLESGQEILVTDTVGFIRKLPHHLIDAFRSTLEEAKYADIIIHMVDAASPIAQNQMQLVYDTLSNLGIEDKPILTAFNKQDMIESEQICKDVKADKSVRISAKYGDGIEELLKVLENMIQNSQVYIEKIIPYTRAGDIQIIRKYGQLLFEEYQEDGIMIKAYVPKSLNLG